MSLSPHHPLSLFTRASWRYSILGCSLAAPRLLSILILISGAVSIMSQNLNHVGEKESLPGPLGFPVQSYPVRWGFPFCRPTPLLRLLW